jgi:hypothetical protein
MKNVRWQTGLVVSFVAASIAVYAINYLIFHNAHDIFFYTLLDIAFLPIQVLLVTLIIHRLLEESEKQARLKKLNMVIGAFFSEAGTGLLATFSGCDPMIDTIRKDLIVTDRWTSAEFQALANRLKGYEYGVEIDKVDLGNLRSYLLGKRDFMLRLLENPNLLEHELFTEMLQAVFHITEELLSRDDMTDLPALDKAHLAGDIKRGYSRLVYQWLAYMQHLRDNYPYLFSLAIRTNPFDRGASAIIGPPSQ